MTKDDLRIVLRDLVDDFSDTFESCGKMWRYKYRLTDKDAQAVEAASLQVYNKFIDSKPSSMSDEIINFFDEINSIIKVQPPKFCIINNKHKFRIGWEILFCIYYDDKDFIGGFQKDCSIEWE